MGSVIWRQVVALLRRNLLLKRRKLRQTIFELVVPVYFAAILGAVKLGVNPSRRPDILTPPCWNQSATPTRANSTEASLLFAPNSSVEVRAIMSRAVQSMGITERGFANTSDLLDFYRMSTGSVIGAVVFNNVTGGEVPTAYDLRFDSEAADLPKTSKLFLNNNGFCRITDESVNTSKSGYGNTFECPTIGLLSSGLMQVQSAVDTAILQVSESLR